MGFMLEAIGFVTLGFVLRNGWPVGMAAWLMVSFAAGIILLGYDLIDPRKAK